MRCEFYFFDPHGGLSSNAPPSARSQGISVRGLPQAQQCANIPGARRPARPHCPRAPPPPALWPCLWQCCRVGKCRLPFAGYPIAALVCHNGLELRRPYLVARPLHRGRGGEVAPRIDWLGTTLPGALWVASLKIHFSDLNFELFFFQ